MSDVSPSSAPTASALRAAVTAAHRRPEPECLPPLLAAAELPPVAAEQAAAQAAQWVRALRQSLNGSQRGLLQALLHEFSLSSQEGVALMCLAEALLRIPDGATRDALIRDKIGHADWGAHLHGRSLFAGAAAWGLLITGRLLATHDEAGLSAAAARLLARGGEPLVRRAMNLAVGMLGSQFVIGETIEQGLARAQKHRRKGFAHSFDMLGEAAATDDDAQRYLRAYEHAIDAVGREAGSDVIRGPGISVKLSALHPRYARAQRDRVHAELYPRLLHLFERARRAGLGVHIDAEEADRLSLSLELLERLCAEPGLEGWAGIGFAVQAYQKRCPAVVDVLIDLARRSRRRLMVRLVKGAYWDTEIKLAQAGGFDDYPVYTRKAHTDVAYLACARHLLDAPDAVYPQFATHNAYTVARIMGMAGPWQPDQYEFQCLHGMGEPLFEPIVGAPGGQARPCRIYAPVGRHETLLAYLVRRLLENGANSSFVNRVADPQVAVDLLVEDPVRRVKSDAGAGGRLGAPHPSIPLPRDLYAGYRANSAGLDLSDDRALAAVEAALRSGAATVRHARPPAGPGADGNPAQPVRNPADAADLVGTVCEAGPHDIAAAIEAAGKAWPRWASRTPQERAAVLARAAALMQDRMCELAALVIREAGKTWANAVGEVREAIDFLYYYAARIDAPYGAERIADGPERSRGPNDTGRGHGPNGAERGRPDVVAREPLGVAACISPWNFPLSIFTGQVAAALAAGNAVLAKPAEQTPLIAAEAVRLLHQAGVPADALQLLPGRGETVGAALAADPRVDAVLFTGSLEVARQIRRQLAERLGRRGRPVPLVAETGGRNAMIVDSSALAEQVVADALASAFDSAGQRCSALRLLCLQEDVADRIMAMLRGALAELRVGDPRRLHVDVGPIIDAPARRAIDDYLAQCRARGWPIHQPAAGQVPAGFVAPAIVEVDAPARLEREVFGPVLHVLRFPRGGLDALVDGINALGDGLTLGIHSRIDQTIAAVTARARVGNIYVNRNMIGAVVGVQPFGGEGRSGTGPKAGGPLYLRRLLARPPLELDICLAGLAPIAPGAWPPAAARDAAPRLLPISVERAADEAFHAFTRWAAAPGRESLARDCATFRRRAASCAAWQLPGPTGESNIYLLRPRAAVACLAASPGDALRQLAAVLALGMRVIWPSGPPRAALAAQLPPAVRARITLSPDWTKEALEVALCHGNAEELIAACRQAADRDGPIIRVEGYRQGDTDITLDALLRECVISANTAAAGGNATLMTLSD
ncbi:trifunctional transcriptional regulator/proline dehydrogenase/L-glutamate gamma-semialdehyde dehydrogenase [Pigmentiphaga soli]|uniref:Bifunctional protein PutA n=1 Tax=Pigmentiphaga soli TaxID=1007095 RepID=A0ABP8H5M6_9BURK